ncbi:type I restriction endonuclease subunit M [Methylomonas sp. Kb3]|uniref:HsdM family class I SAM-dependent methyltransferase n=1 Tax=Methylomonas sp. Kb3 TaxID=1611544 RepID=UPI000C323909|nr:class I SAM-dependent DNA methyltransferase [Methylomonas sp. Kb3]PKD41270.1 type I restriction endonuclease subunit M [Methylomonas sp. Kb3]
MAIKKSDLYSSLWASCDQLRGGMDASQYKDYVLFMLFIKYITDKYADSDDFAPPVVIPPGASFKDMIALKCKSDIGDKINTQIIGPLVNANARLSKSDFPDFNDPNKLGEGKDMVEKLSNLISIFQKPELDFSKNRAEHDDILGDAYEYLMRHFATESGKSKGQFYTPSEVSRIIAKVIGISPENAKGSTTAYDPTCGSGSLLLKVAAEAGKHITLEGQEKDVTTAGLARMNMILHDFPTATILSGNTLASPKFKDGENLRTYDYVVANPPFSDKTWSTGLTPGDDAYQRFVWGEPPAKQGDYAYLLHIIRSLKANGKAACILPHGVLFRGNAEAVIRQQLVRSGYLKGIIGLPANLFYGTGIPACILVIDKENATARKGVFMLDAAKGFIKDGNKNRLREQDIHKIVDTFSKQADVPRYARMVPFDEIADPKNDFNLNLPRYIDSSEPEDIQDINGHLNGGIPERDLDALADYWRVLPGVRAALFSPRLEESAAKQSNQPSPFGRGQGEGTEINVLLYSDSPHPNPLQQERERPGYAQLTLPLAEVKPAIFGHAEFTAFNAQATERFQGWLHATTPLLTGFGKDSHPKALIETIAEDLLNTFKPAPLLDAYDIYQHLMDYWAETMQDDCYLISADGWVAQPTRIVETDKKGKTKDKGWVCDLIPKPYIVARYFAEEQAAIEAKQAELETATASQTELEEEHNGEDAIFSGYDNINAAAVKDRIKELGKDPDGADELKVLKQWLELGNQISGLKKQIKEAEAVLDQKAYEKYPTLSEAEIKTLVIDDKWMAHLSAAVQGELDRVSQTLTGRIRQLAERYATPLPQLEDEAAALAVRVAEHLKKMGVVWP